MLLLFWSFTAKGQHGSDGDSSDSAGPLGKYFHLLSNGSMTEQLHSPVHTKEYQRGFNNNPDPQGKKQLF